MYVRLLPLSKNLFVTDMIISHFPSRMTNVADAKGVFPVDKRKISYPSAVSGDSRIFADPIRIMQLFDPYSIYYLIREDWSLEVKDQMRKMALFR